MWVPVLQVALWCVLKSGWNCRLSRKVMEGDSQEVDALLRARTTVFSAHCNGWPPMWWRREWERCSEMTGLWKAGVDRIGSDQSAAWTEAKEGAITGFWPSNHPRVLSPPPPSRGAVKGSLFTCCSGKATNQRESRFGICNRPIFLRHSLIRTDYSHPPFPAHPHLQKAVSKFER